MMDTAMRTISDMERLYYTEQGIRMLGPEDLYVGIAKADAPVLTTTTGVYNVRYGAQVWNQFNMEANAFGCFPKYPWGRSGWRVISARAATRPWTAIAEGGAVPDSIKPTFATQSTKPKYLSASFETSEIEETLASLGADDAAVDMAMMRQEMAVELKDDINFKLLYDTHTAAAAAGNHLESLDRIVSNYSEAHAFDSGNETYYDVYGDTVRSADTGSTGFKICYVNHASGTDRDLTDTLLTTLMLNVRANGGFPTMFMTGYDTYAAIQNLYDTQVRYNIIGATKMQVGVNGIETASGMGVGLDISTLYGIPLIVSKDAPVDSISRLFLLDTSNPEGFDMPRLGIKVAKPVQYFEVGVNMGTPFAVPAGSGGTYGGKFTNKGLYRMLAELICTNFKAQGKLRDLK